MKNLPAFTCTPKKRPSLKEFFEGCVPVDDFAMQTLNQLGAEEFIFLSKADENMNEDDGSDDFQQVTADGYYFLYKPDNLKVLVAVTDYDYMVALVDDDEDGSYIDNMHDQHCSEIPLMFKELLQNFKASQIKSIRTNK